MENPIYNIYHIPIGIKVATYPYRLFFIPPAMAVDMENGIVILPLTNQLTEMTLCPCFDVYCSVT